MLMLKRQYLRIEQLGGLEIAIMKIQALLLPCQLSDVISCWQRVLLEQFSTAQEHIHMPARHQSQRVVTVTSVVIKVQ